MIAGAGQLERRIAEHAPWRLADAVLDGRQPATDPHEERLIEIGDGVRRYGPDTSFSHSDEAPGFEKRLLDGWWRVSTSATP